MKRSNREPVTVPAREFRNGVVHAAATTHDGDANDGDESSATADAVARDSGRHGTPETSPPTRRRAKFVDPNSLIALGEI